MKLLMPFWDLKIMPRYIPQLTAIAKHCTEFNIIYTEGEPREEWTHFNFYKVSLKDHGNRSLNWLTSREHIAQQLNHVDYDLVYTLSGRWMQYYAAYIAEKAGVPQVVRLRGDPETVDGIVTPGVIKRLLLNQMYRESFTKAALVIPIAEKLKPVARSYGAKHVSAPVPNGVDLDKFQVRPMPPMYHALYVGRVSPEKGSDFLCRLMHHTPEITYGVAGPIQCNWNPPGNCETLGQVPYEEIQGVYSRANIVLLPSLTEGFPNTLLEAYACGRSVIGTPDAIPAEFKVYGLRVRQDVETWAELLRRIKWFNLEEMGLQAREYVKQFSWEKYGINMARLLTGVLNHEPIQIDQEVEVIAK